AAKREGLKLKIIELIGGSLLLMSAAAFFLLAATEGLRFQSPLPKVFFRRPGRRAKLADARLRWRHRHPGGLSESLENLAIEETAGDLYLTASVSLSAQVCRSLRAAFFFSLIKFFAR